jgi:hypothetical protein
VSAAQQRANAARRKAKQLSVADIASLIGRTPLQVRWLKENMLPSHLHAR